jgi:uncharacterized protein
VEQSDFVVILNRLPPEGVELAIRVDDPARAGIELALPLDGPLEADLAVRRLEGELSVTGEVRATVLLECARCLRPFPLPVRGAVAAVFAPRAEAAGEGDRELEGDDLEVQPLEHGAADLRAVIAEQVHLAVPIKPLCAEDCRGICPQCGADHAGGPCGCAAPPGDPRWEALRKLAVPG